MTTNERSRESICNVFMNTRKFIGWIGVGRGGASLEQSVKVFLKLKDFFVVDMVFVVGCASAATHQ